MDIQANITITITGAPLVVDVSGVPATDQVGVPYSGAIKATGGVPPYTFTITSGALPPGLSLNPDGTITGTPTIAGVYTATIDVADNAGATARITVKSPGV